MTSLQLLDPKSIWAMVWLRCRGARADFELLLGWFWRQTVHFSVHFSCDLWPRFPHDICRISAGNQDLYHVFLLHPSPLLSFMANSFFNQAQPSSSAIWSSSSPQCQRQWCIIELEMLALSGGGTRPYPMTQAGVQRWGEGWGGTVGTSESSRIWISAATAFSMLDPNESILAFPERPSIVHMPILSSLNL